MPKRARLASACPVAIQLLMFPDAASLIRIRADATSGASTVWRSGPICSVGRCCWGNGAASALKADAGWIRTPITAQPSTRLPVSPDASDVVAIRIVAYDQFALADWLCTTSWEAASAAPNSPHLMPMPSAKNRRPSPRDVVRR